MITPNVLDENVCLLSLCLLEIEILLKRKVLTARLFLTILTNNMKVKAVGILTVQLNHAYRQLVLTTSSARV